METDTGVHALLVSKFKMFSFLLLKQRLFSGLLLGCGKKSQVLRDFQSQIHEKISREFHGNFWGLTSPKKIGKKWPNILAKFR